jgi:hypothetical protein
MTRPKLIPLLFGCFLAVPLSACASTPSVDETAAEAGISSAQSDDGDSSSSDSGESDDGGNPGGPGDTDGGGGGGGGGGNPGAPGDVAVFEEAGVPHSVLRDDAANKCADGVCTLLEPVPTVGDPDDVGGLDECIIQEQSDISYDPPAQDGFFQEGATVQARVDCTDDESGELEGTDETETTDGDGSETTDETETDGDGSDGSGTSDTDTSDEAPADEPQG